MYKYIFTFVFSREKKRRGIGSTKEKKESVSSAKMSYRSIEIAMRVKTLPQMDMMATNWLILQYMRPKGQSLCIMYVKLKITLRVETIVSATDKLTYQDYNGGPKLI